MKISILTLAVVLAAGPILAATTGTAIPELTTLTGRTYRQCRISQVHPDGVSFFHAKGAAKVLFDDLSDTWKTKLGYNAQRAKDYEKELAVKKFMEQERRARMREEMARQQREEADLHLRIMERAALARERQLLQYHQQLAAYYRQAGLPLMPVPAVGWPGAYVGPVNAVLGQSLGGPEWARGGSIGLASIGGGSGGVLGGGHSGCVWVGGGGIVNSPTLGAYVPGRFAAFGSTAPFGGVYLGGARGFGQVGLASVAYGFAAPAAVCAPVIRSGSVGLPISR